MFDVGWTELVVIACVAILVVGPKDLPGMLRTFGKTVGGLRRMAGDFQRQFNDALKEAEREAGLEEVQKAANFKPLEDARKSAEAFQESIKKTVSEPEAAASENNPAVATDATPAETVAKPEAKKASTKAAAKPASKPAKPKAAAKAKSAAKPAAAKSAVAKPAAKKTAKAGPKTAAKTAAPKRAASKAAKGTKNAATGVQG
ncbi:MAG: Sec-independent protein translocase protein TatB [Salaquimonas sp.]|nr:Sec-independent protein translocase protein TatB [Salaquimonas sp.]